MLHGSERIFPQKRQEKTDETKETTASNVTDVTNEAEESPGMPSVTNVKGLMQVTEVNLQSFFHTEKAPVLCDSSCSISWVCEKLARRLNVQGTPLKLTVNGINSHETIETQIVGMKLTPVHSGGFCPAFVVKPYVREDLNVGTEVIDVETLQVQYPHLESIPLKKYCYGDVEMILGQDMFH